MGTSQADKLLGVRDGFQRYFQDGVRRALPISVKAEPDPRDGTCIPLTDEECLARANERVVALRARTDPSTLFCVCSEMGIHSLELDGESLHFVRSWTVILGPGSEEIGARAVGGSGSLQLPPALIEGLDGDQIPFAIPGKRRRGGMTSSLTGGLETRRHAISLATVEALSTLLYGVLEGRRRPLRL